MSDDRNINALYDRIDDLGVALAGAKARIAELEEENAALRKVADAAKAYRNMPNCNGLHEAVREWEEGQK